MTRPAPRCSWLRPALFLAAAFPRLLAAAEVEVVPPAHILVCSDSHRFTARVSGSALPVTWSLPQGEGFIDAESGLLTPDPGLQDDLATVTVRATLATVPPVSGEVSVYIVPPRIQALVPREFMATMAGREPHWLPIWLARRSFHDPETKALPLGAVAPEVQPDATFAILDGGLRLCPGPRILGYGLPFDVCFDAFETPDVETLLSWGTPGRFWHTREVTGERAFTLRPDPTWTVARAQHTVVRKGRAVTTTRTLEVKLRGVLPLAGRAATPGHANGAGPAALLSRPSGLALLAPGHEAWRAVACDSATHVIRLVTASGKVATYAGQPHEGGGFLDGPAAVARFNQPTFLAVDGDTVYVADTGNHVIRRIVAGRVDTLAGTPGRSGYRESAGAPEGRALFNQPHGLALDGQGHLYVADRGNQVIRRISLATGIVELVAGTPGRAGTRNILGGQFWDPKGLAFQKNTQGDVLLVLDGNSLRGLLLDKRVVYPYLGVPGEEGFLDGGPSGSPCLRRPWGLALNGNQIFIADEGNHAVRLVAVKGGDFTLRTVAGDPSLTTPRPGLHRGATTGSMPQGPLRDYYAALESPRALLALPHRMETLGYMFLLADGTTLRELADVPGPSRVIGKPLFGPLPEALEAARPVGLSFALSPPQADGTSYRLPFRWSLEFLAEDGTPARETMTGCDGGQEMVVREWLPAAAGPLTLRLSALAQNGHVEILERRVTVVPPGAGGPALPAPPVPEKKAAPVRKAPEALPPAPKESKAAAAAAPLAPPRTKVPAGAAAGRSALAAAPAAPPARTPDRPLPEAVEAGIFIPVVELPGRRKLARLGFCLDEGARRHIRQRHVDPGDPFTSHFSDRFAKAPADTLRGLIAEGLSPEGRVREEAGTRPNRRQFLCKGAKVGMVTDLAGATEETDHFLVVAWRNSCLDRWEIITAYPVPRPAPAAGTDG